MVHRTIGWGDVVVLAVMAAAGLAPRASAQDQRFEDRKMQSRDPLLRDDRLGQSVAVSGRTIYAGGIYDYTLDYGGGSVFAFDMQTGNQRAKFRAPDTEGNDWFGYSIAISGDLMVVGAPYNNALGDRAGAAYLFNIATGEYLHRLVPLDPEAVALFGLVVAIDGGHVAVAAPYQDDGATEDTGAVYVFAANSGAQIAKLAAVNGGAEDHLGLGLAINMSDRIVACGAPGEDNGSSEAGKVYLFDALNGSQSGTIVPIDPVSWGEFGASVEYRGNRFIVGSPGANGREGALYVFNSLTRLEIAKIASPDPIPDGRFGYACLLTDDHILVGEPGDPFSRWSVGRVYVFDRTDYTPLLEMLETDPPPGWPYDERDDFGVAIAADSPLCVIGAPLHDRHAGGVYAYNFSPRVLETSGSVFTETGAGPAEFEVTAENALTYQWRFEGVELQDDGLHSGTQTRSLSVIPRLSTEGSYDVVMTNSLGTTVSPPMVLAVRQSCLADVNGDGTVDVRDVLTFLNLWSAGCP